MVTIEVGNSTSKIIGLVSGPFNKLRKLLSYSTDPSAAFFAGGRYPKLKYCVDLKGAFLTGLLPRVEAFLVAEKIPYSIADSRLESIKAIRKVDHKASFKHIKPYEFQVEATDALIKNHRGIISATTGSGKSLIIALITARLNVKTLVVVPSLQIKEQLLESFQGIFSDMSNITIENIDSAALMFARGFGCLIIDEAHHAAAKTYQRLNKVAWADIPYRAFLTATPFRNQTEETLMFEGVAGQVIYKLTYAESVKKGLIVPIEAFYVEVPKTKIDAFTWAEVYSTLVTHNETRNQIIAKMILNLGLGGLSTLCLVKEIKHGNNLAELTGFPFANGQDETTRHYIEKFNAGEIKVLIGTEGVLSEGVDSKACEYVVLTALGKAKSALMQKIGRCVRKFPGKETGKVIIFKDRSHKFTLRHFNEQVKIILAEFGTKVLKLDL